MTRTSWSPKIFTTLLTGIFSFLLVYTIQVNLRAVEKMFDEIAEEDDPNVATSEEGRTLLSITVFSISFEPSG